MNVAELKETLEQLGLPVEAAVLEQRLPNQTGQPAV
ncbi:MAG: SAP domain-containing protein [Bacillota bacterium]